LAAALAAAFAAIIYLGGYPLYRQKLWREAAVFTGLTLLAGYFSFVHVLQLPVYNPAETLFQLFSPMIELIF